MAKTALTPGDKQIVDASEHYSDANVLGQDDAELITRLTIRVRDSLNDLPATDANRKKCYQLMAKNLRWVANYYDEKAAAIP